MQTNKEIVSNENYIHKHTGFAPDGHLEKRNLCRSQRLLLSTEKNKGENYKKMELEINNKYRITSDKYQWTIQEKRTRKGEDDWNSILYYATFEHAINGLRELMVRLSDANTLTDALRDVENVTTQLSQAIPDTLRIKILNEEWFQIDNREALRNDE